MDIPESHVRDTREKWKAIERDNEQTLNAGINYEQARIAPIPSDRGKALNYPITSPLISSRSIERRGRSELSMQLDQATQNSNTLPDDGSTEPDRAVQFNLPDMPAYTTRPRAVARDFNDSRVRPFLMILVITSASFFKTT